MEKMLCKVRLTPLSYPNSVGFEVRPIELPTEPWIEGQARPWAEMKADLEAKGHDLFGADRELAEGRDFITTEAKLHFYGASH